MPFPPALPVGGVAGLRFLDRTYDRQFATFNKSPEIQREIDYFRENAESITSVDQLMGDRRILSVVLGAFGLGEDLDKRAFIRKVLEEGTLDAGAFANRLVDPSYRELSEALGFGNFNGNGTLILENVRNNILAQFQERSFELAMGDVDLDMRLALNFRREAAKQVGSVSNERTAWLRLLGSPPLRQVVEGALNLPSEFGAADIDQQVDEIARRASSTFGINKPQDLLAPDLMQRFIDRFLLTSQVAQGAISASTPGSVALSVLQSSGLGALGGANLFASNF